MECPKCGANVENGTQFCSKCGAEVLAAQPVMAGSAPQPQFTQNSHSAPPPQPQNYVQPQRPVKTKESPMSVGSYILTMIVFAIPILNIIMMFVWAFGSNVNRNKKNFSRATLILLLIGIVLSIIFSILAGTALASIFNSSYSHSF
jgi:uncharacterized membrane protein YvbJ